MVSAILAKAGGNFALNSVDTWNPRGGELEHPLAIQASVEIDRSEKWKKISRSVSRFYENRALDKLGRLLKVADFVKYPPRSEKFPVLGARLGCQPSCVVIIRPFVDFAMSFMRMNNLDWTDLESIYRRSLFTSVLLAKIFGGCVIRYRDIVNFHTDSWLLPLANATGLDPQCLEKSARALVTPRNDVIYNAPIDRELDEILKALGHPNFMD